MTPLTESGWLAFKFGAGLVAAGVSAGGALLAQTLETGMTKNLLENGFAGLFILFLIACLKILWDAKKADNAAAIARQDVLANRLSDLEKEIRNELRGDLQAAQASRAEMIQALKQKSP